MAYQTYGRAPSVSDLEIGFEEPENDIMSQFIDPYANWTRPDGPLRVGLQVGHWKAADAPDEQENLRVNTGASAGGTTEWETNLKITEETKKLLEAKGVVVDILPVTIPPDYWADVFIAIHADGNARHQHLWIQSRRALARSNRQSRAVRRDSRAPSTKMRPAW
jgi:hypothetical protein